ncbi:MAG: electron transport complex subunit RsxC [Pseudomonadota bacterium]
MPAATQSLSNLPGGLRLPANKRLSSSTDIIDVEVPEELIIPLQQHAGDAALPLVQAGDRVLAGQRIGESDGAVSACVHASSSGVVTAIEMRPLPARGEPSVPCVVIRTDGTDTFVDQRATEPFDGSDPVTALRQIQRAGIVGLGGAAYPTAQKITNGYQAGIETVILNGVECESYISCDDRLMREQARAVFEGGQILRRIVTAKHLIVAVESDKAEALEALRLASDALADESISIVEVPTVYPSGGEDQLVLLLTGQEVPSGGLPSDLKLLVQNVGTAVAIAELAQQALPLISRIVTVTGEGVERPGNYRIRIGTPIADVIRAAGGYNDSALRLIMGGPMTGVALTDDALPVIKACNCLLVTGPAVHISPEPRRTCIRCGECAEHCPVRLLPQTLLKHAPSEDIGPLCSFGLDDCIECGCCDLVCPSHIPLTQIFREAKQAVRIRTNERLRADRAKERFEAHATRALEQSETKAKELDEKRQIASSAAIDAIIARKKARQKDSDS